MSLRPLWIAALLVSLSGGACGGEGKEAEEPTTAKEKMRREEARSKDKDDAPTKSWGKWRYKGDAESCFFRVGSKCFKTEAAACSAARCKKPEVCTSEGAAPADVSCKKS